MTDESIIHVEIEADSLDQLKAFADESKPDLGCRPVARRAGAKFLMHAYFPEGELEAARASRSAAGVTIRVVENATEVGRQRQQEVGRGNRYASRGTVPRGLGRKE